MKLISSKTTVYHKRIFPFFWFGFMILFALMVLWLSIERKEAVPLVMFIPVAIMAVFSYFIFKKLLFDLVDEVWDAGDRLIVKNKNKEEYILLSDIKNISEPPIYMSPARVTLTLRKPSCWGSEITFAIPVKISLFQKQKYYPIIANLIERVDEKRSVVK